MVTLPLTAVEATLERAGGKGANLAILTRAGLPVPFGFIVTTDAYAAYVSANGLQPDIIRAARDASPADPASLADAAARIQACFDPRRLSPELADDIAGRYSALFGHPPRSVAVRSSATAEDLPGLSFAGQQDTYLNVVGRDAVLDAVVRCWASLWTARAIGYRARNGTPPESVSMAVVVQAMVDADVSGVLFTSNPVTGKRDEMVIDASFGLGEAIVSGQVEPDHYVVDARSRRVLSRAAGAKALAIVPADGGGTRREDRAPASDQALSDDHILALAALAARIAEHYGEPQDIEFAFAGGRPFVLQSRPITTLYPLPADDAPADGNPKLYFSFNSVQGVADPFTVAGSATLTVLVGSVYGLMGIRRPVEDSLFVAGDRLYLDATDLVRDPRLRRIFLTLLSAVDPVARDIITSLVAQGRFGSASAASPAAFLRTARRMRFAPVGAAHVWLRPEAEARRRVARAEQALAAKQRAVASAQGLEARLDAIEAQVGTLMPQLGRDILPLVLPGFGALRMTDVLLGRWLGEPSAASLPLTRGMPNNVTTEMNLRLWSCASAIAADPAGRDAFLTQPVEALVEALHDGTLPDATRRALEAFLQNYGARANAEIDVGRPRWREDPAPIIGTLQGLLRINDPTVAPDAQFEASARQADAFARDVLDRLRRTRFGRIKARILGAAMHRVRMLSGYRETPKWIMIRLFDSCRIALLDSGRELAAAGALMRADDVFHVPFADLRAHARGARADLNAIAQAHRAGYERERLRRLMPRVMLSSGEAFYEADGRADAGADGAMTGQAVSPGSVEGPARVVLDPRGAALLPGEILVCPATDPGWTPLFFAARGLVMEVGGMVTHGSVVAREYGIPAVVGVAGATTRIRTGQHIRVDGTRGRVTLLDGAPA